MKGFSIGLALKQRQNVTRKCLINTDFDSEITIKYVTFACSKMKVKRTEKRSIAKHRMMGTRQQTQPSMKKMLIVMIQVRSRDTRLSYVIRELKQRRRRRRGQRLVKNEFIFCKRNLRLSGSVRYANGSKNVLQLHLQRRRSIPNGNTKN